MREGGVREREGCDRGRGVRDGRGEREREGCERGRGGEGSGQ